MTGQEIQDLILERSGTFRTGSGTLAAVSVPPPPTGSGTEHSNRPARRRPQNGQTERSPVGWFPEPSADHARPDALRCSEHGCDRPITIHPDFDPHRPMQYWSLPEDLCTGHGQMSILARALSDGQSTESVLDGVAYAREAFAFDFHNMKMLASREHVIYRLFGEFGQLLYVGISNDITRRLREHSKEKGWWPEVRGHTHEICIDREDAIEREARAIRTEHPKYNIVGRRLRRSGAVR